MHPSKGLYSSFLKKVNFVVPYPPPTIQPAWAKMSLIPDMLPHSFPVDSLWTGKMGKMRVGGGEKERGWRRRGSTNGKEMEIGMGTERKRKEKEEDNKGGEWERKEEREGRR